jgi:hypothetical protein
MLIFELTSTWACSFEPWPFQIVSQYKHVYNLFAHDSEAK